jgi:poly(3-hydroxybutyrate) depolymerase/sugar lactone lactonase YvrE
MLYRLWSILLSASILLGSPPARLGISSIPAEQTSRINAPNSPGALLPDKIADRVLGQAAFNTSGSGTSAAALWLPAGIAIAPPTAPDAGRLFVVEYGSAETGVETGNHRVLSWPSVASFTNGQAADLVFGQDNFNTQGGGLDYTRFYGPEAAVVDAAGNLWVADTLNHRVLRFQPPFSNGMSASVVLGQPDFDTSNSPNQGGSAPAANTLYFPRGLAVDGASNLYVADDYNNRVLGFAAPFTSNMNAVLVIGQADFTSGEPNRGGAAGQNTLNSPKGLAMDAAGNLYVAEYDNNRVTRFSPPFSNGMNAGGLIGQPDFTSTTENNGGRGPGSLSHPVDIAVSAAGDALFVTDQGNDRVLGYLDPLSDAIADQVYGQPSFSSYTPNNGGVSAISINTEPLGVAVDASNNLYFADFRNNRVLAYDYSPVQVIGDGTPGSCSEAALDAALANGGRIEFDCGAMQIDLGGAKSISTGTVIDGGGAIILRGNGADRLFVVNAGASLILQNIVLTDGSSSGDGGAIYNSGALELENSTARKNQAGASGGVIVNYGSLTIADSLLEGNKALNGGALYPRWSGAQTIILNSVLRNNQATDTTNGWGGAILAWDGAQVSILGSEISNNTAQIGGGIYNFDNSLLSIVESTLRDNHAASSGGGLFNANNASAYLEGITLSGNSSGDNGGAWMNYGSGDVFNSTLSTNSAVNEGGALDNWGSVRMMNVTLSGNSAASGGGISNFDALSVVILENSIVANSPSGGNCAGASLTNNNSDQYSISSDDTCGLAGTGSQNGIDPLLTNLGNYGGPTQVHMLKPGSPAIDGVVGDSGPDYDQRGVSRPQGGGFDIGAVEATADDLLKHVYLPFTIGSPGLSQPGADTYGTILVNGYARNFVFAVSGYPAPAAGRPLVIHLHGDGGDMHLSEAWKNAVLNDANGAVLLSAQGRNQIDAAALIDGSAWRFRMDEAGEPYDDIDFIDQLITQATANDILLGTPIDPNQVYVVGESRGAGFAYFLYADPRTRNKIRAIVPISGTFYCEGEVVSDPSGMHPKQGSDLTCGEMSTYGYWEPKPALFSAPGVTRAAHILDIHGQLPPDGNESQDTAPPILDLDFQSTQWAGWSDAAGCYTVQVSSQTEQTLAKLIGGKTVKTYAYSQTESDLATRCAGLDLTFYIVQGGGHVPGGFEPTAWCFLSTVGGKASPNACQLAGN